MTYTVRIKDETWSLENDDGKTILSDEPLPAKTPDDIMDAILDDMGVGEPQKEAFKVLFKQDWEVINDSS